jgi:hypothetical protein
MDDGEVRFHNDVYQATFFFFFGPRRKSWPPFILSKHLFDDGKVQLGQWMAVQQ